MTVSDWESCPSLTRVRDAASFAQQSHLAEHDHPDWVIVLGLPKTCLRNFKILCMCPFKRCFACGEFTQPTANKAETRQRKK